MYFFAKFNLVTVNRIIAGEPFLFRQNLIIYISMHLFGVELKVFNSITPEMWTLNIANIFMGKVGWLVGCRIKFNCHKRDLGLLVLWVRTEIVKAYEFLRHTDFWRSHF